MRTMDRKLVAKLNTIHNGEERNQAVRSNTSGKTAVLFRGRVSLKFLKPQGLRSNLGNGKVLRQDADQDEMQPVGLA